ncbi:MAG: PucR family transcriptional regulator [Actinobacteria bacterium]|nr:PucR family transcriptional regulator [Actinomycetota bacterium]
MSSPIETRPPPASPELSIAEFLTLPPVRRGAPEVVAGAADLARPIRWVHSGEVANIASLLHGGELLLTTGMGIGDSEKARSGFVESLAARGVVAIAIELGTTLETLPPALVRTAAEADVCLIAFHREIRFVDVTEAFHQRILDTRASGELRGDDLRGRFAELLLAGKEARDLLTELAGFVRNPVVLAGADGAIAYHVPFRSDDAAVLGAWDSVRRGGASAPRLVEQPVPLGDGSTGRLLVLELDATISPADRFAVGQAVDLVAIALMRDREGERLTGHRRGDFLAELVSGTESAESELARRAADLGFEAVGPDLMPIAVRVAGATPGDRRWDPVRVGLARELAGRRIARIAGAPGEGGDLQMVVGLSAAERPRIADLVAAALRRTVAREFGGEAEVTVCVGPAVSSWEEVGKELAAVGAALPAAAQVEQREWYDAELPDVDRLLWGLREDPELGEFVDRRIGPLLAWDEGGRANLLRTLEVFCECGGHKTEAARALQIERRTLYHRLARIEEILAVDLSHGRSLLGLHLAIRAHHFR